jgi:trigger factor
MQVTQTNIEGLKREFRVVVPAGEVEDMVARRLGEIGRSVQIPGFRPGKVPMQILRRRYGPSVLGEVLESTVQGSSAEAIREHNLRPALPPKVEIQSFGEGADLEYKMSVELLPDIPALSFGDLDVERLIVEVPTEEVDRAIERIAEQQRKSEAVDRPAESGDILVVDLEGRTGAQEIPGAAGKDRHILLGAAGHLPGFEDQLIGAKAGEQRTVSVTFPEDYAAVDLGGKEGVFTVDVKEVRQRLPAAIDEELAKEAGLETLAELREELKQRMQRDYDALARLRFKRVLLDKLAQSYDFPVPPGMVELEFSNIWAQRQSERELGESKAEAAASTTVAAAEPEARTEPFEEPVAGSAPEAKEEAGTGAAQAGEPEPPSSMPEEPRPESGAAAGGASEADEAAKTEYRRIAERRVRLGLLLAEVGRSNNIVVSQDELNQAITREARRHPGYERQMLEYYRQNPDAVGALRAPIFEDKVIDFITELAKPAERRITPQELLGLHEPEDAAAAAN